MINKDNCILLGTLAKPHGTRGSLIVRFSGLKAEDIKKRGLVFVEIDGLPVPFFIESFQEKTEDTVILKMEGIDYGEQGPGIPGLSRVCDERSDKDKISHQKRSRISRATR